MVAVLDRTAQAGMARLRADPAAFMREWLGADIWQKQIEIVESVRDHRRTSVKSCHASGKSFISARVAIWFLHAYPQSLVITTAPTFNQVKNILWREIGAAARSAKRPLLGRCLTTSYDIAPDWYGLGFKADDASPDRFQGFHSEHVLVIIDEAAGVAEPVYEALDAAMTSQEARLLLIGNPTNPSGTFHDSHHSDRSLYNCITIAAADTPNIQAGQTVRPYLITQAWIDDAVAKHGEDSPYVQARVRAVFPALTDNALIPLAWIESAHYRRVDDVDAAYEAGLDVARMGSDENALCIRRGPCVLAEYSWSGIDTMQTVGKVKYLLSQHPRVEKLKVDVIGVGAGVADRLREEGYPVVDINVSNSASDPEKFTNLRCEIWWELRERFREGGIAGPIHDVTMGQLSSIRYAYDSRHSRPVIESKDVARKRGVKSPDRAEALLLAFSGLSTASAPTAAAEHSRWSDTAPDSDDDEESGWSGRWR